VVGAQLVAGWLEWAEDSGTDYHIAMRALADVDFSGVGSSQPSPPPPLESSKRLDSDGDDACELLEKLGDDLRPAAAALAR
jgi:hypothetical protein